MNGTTYNYNYDSGDKLQTVKVGGTTVKSYGYDAAGRTKSVVTGAGTTSLSYDYEDRVSGITYPSSATNSFTYNGLDARVGKVDSTGTSTYKRDGADVTDPVLSDGSIAYTPGLSERKSSTTTFDHADFLGTFIRQTSSSQSTIATRVYDAFGNLESTTGTPQSPFGFAGDKGYQEDADSGLKLLGHRYYDPSTGRFLTRDPAKDGRNWFDYCANNPLAATDGSGQSWGAVLGGILGTVVGVAIITAGGGVPLILGLVVVGIFAGSGTAIGGSFSGDKSLPAIQQNFAEGALGGVGGVLTLGAAPVDGAPVFTFLRWLSKL